MKNQVLVAALLLASYAAMAGDIYVCKGSNGVKSYQGTPCANATDQLSRGAYDDSLGREGTPVSASNSDTQALPVTQTMVQESNPGPGALAPVAEPAGYQCQAGSRLWVQKKPCPATYTVSKVVDVDGHDQSGNLISGTGTIQQEAPVQSKQMTSDDICDSVHKGVKVAGGSRASDQSYERNKLRNENNCGA